MSRRALLLLAAVCALGTLLCVFVVDDVVRQAQWFGGVGFWRGGQTLIEVLSGIDVHRWYWLMLLLAVAALAASRAAWRPMAIPFIYVAAVHVVVRYATIWLKDATGRLRPFQISWPLDAVSSFGQDGVAFPSGHVTMYFGLLLPLALLYPRWRVPLLAVASFIGVARICLGAHWVSDVLAGVALAALVTAALAVLFRLPRADH